MVSKDDIPKLLLDLSVEERQKALAERKKNAPEQINNASLSAGSPMYFYCESSCQHLAAVLPENFSTSPPKLCPECESLKKTIEAGQSVEV